MKKTNFFILLMISFLFIFLSCNSPSGSSSGTPGNNIPPESPEEPNPPDPVSPRDNITIGLITYEYTGEVQLMETPQTIIGSDDLNQNSSQIGTGAFPAGRNVMLSPFIIGKYQVTQELYEAVMTGMKVKIDGIDTELNSKPSYHTALTNDLYPDEIQKYRPVEHITWFDACYFCNVLSEKTGLEKVYTIDVTEVNSSGNITKATVNLISNANGYRLPTEAEWEYAARGGTKSTAEEFKYYWSGATGANISNYSPSQIDFIKDVAWYYYNSYMYGYGTHQVGKKTPNAADIYDMSGNVAEWCYDYYSNSVTAYDTVYKKDGVIINPLGPTEYKSTSVVRGPGNGNTASECAITFRSNVTTKGIAGVGVRLCRSIF